MAPQVCRILRSSDPLWSKDEGMPDFILEQNGRIKRIAVKGTDLSIGRDEANDLVISEEDVSRNHARLQRLPEGWVLEDLNSANGTLVEGCRSMRAVLGRGTVIGLGECTLTFLGGGEDDNPLAGAPAIEGLSVDRYSGEGPLTVDYSFRRDSDGKEFTVRHIRDVWAEDADYMESLQASADELRIARVQGLVPFEFKRDSASSPYLIEEPLSGCPRREDGRALRMAESEALRISLGVAKILSRMHEHDIRHHGLHPGRVGLTEDGDVELGALAFPQGVATRTPDASVRSLSCLAPEGFSPEGVLGRRSDVYAVGALLHELLLGAPIAEGNTIEGCTRSVLRGIQRSPSERRPGLSPGVSDLIMDCTKLDPQERIEAMDEVVSRLTASLSLSRSRSDAGGAVDPLVRGESERPQRSKLSKWISFAVSGLIFVILQAIVYLLFFKE